MQAAITLRRSSPRNWAIGALLFVLVLVLIVSVSVPNLLRSRTGVSHVVDDSAKIATPGERDALARSAGEIVRRVVQTGEMQLRVSDPAGAAQQLADLSQRLGGFVESSRIYRGSDETTSAHVGLRLPAARLDEARRAIRGLAKRVDSENFQSNDVTAEHADVEAVLRNYHAEEAQYLAIMGHARTVRDTLETAQRLADVRGRIERTQAQLNLMSQQVEMAALTVALTADIAGVPSWNWTPWQNARRAWRDSCRDLADYADAMVALLFRGPAVLAWSVTVLALAAMAWRALRWAWLRWFRTAAQNA